MAAMVQPISLLYFPAPSRGCIPRLCLYTGGIDFNDRAITPPILQELKAEGKAVFGNVPLLQIGDETICQSQAIAM